MNSLESIRWMMHRQRLRLLGESKMVRPFHRGAIGALVAGSLISSSAASAAPALPLSQPNPWAVLTVMNGGASAAAVCGAALAAAAAAQPTMGCVLPRVDAAPLAQTPESVPSAQPYYAAGSSTPPIPVLLVWAAVLATMVYIATKHHHHHHANSPA
jgi:hypothetical protein